MLILVQWKLLNMRLKLESPDIKKPLQLVPFHAAEEIDKHVDDMLQDGVIEPSSSPWAAGVVLVRKKDGTTRYVWTIGS